MKAGLKSCVTFLGVLTLLTVILCAVLLPAVILPFTANLDVASAVDAKAIVNPNLFKNSSFIQNTQGENQYSSANGSNAVLTLDNWYISGYCTLDFLNSSITPVDGSKRRGLLLQPVELTTSGTYTVAIDFKSAPVLGSTVLPYIECYTNLLLDGYKISFATDGASGAFRLNRIEDALYVGTFNVTSTLLNDINSNSTLQFAIGFDIRAVSYLNYVKLEYGSDYTGYEPALSDFEALKSKYDTLSLEYTKLQRELKTAQDNYSKLLTDFETLENQKELLQQSYNALQEKYNQLQSVHEELQATYDALLSDFNLLANSLSYIVAARMTMSNVDTVEDHYNYIQSDIFYSYNYNGFSGIKFDGGAGDSGSVYNTGFYLPLSITVPKDTKIQVTWDYAIAWNADNTTTEVFGLLYGAIDNPTKILSTDVNYYVGKNTLQFTANNGFTNTLEFYSPSDKGTVALFVSGLTVSYSNTSIEALLSSKYNDGIEDGKKQGYDEGYRVGQEKGYAEGSKSQGNYTFLGLIGAVIDAPINSFRQMFDFEVLGVNMSSFMLSLFTISIIIVIIKFVI